MVIIGVAINADFNMPLIKPKKYEKQKDFIVRCIGNGKMASEYKDTDQRMAVCYTIWKENFNPKK